MDIEQRHSTPPTPVRVRKWEVEYDSSDDHQYQDLYKRYDGEERAWPMQEDLRQVIRTGAKPKTRRKVTLVKDDTDASGDDGDDEEAEEAEERIGDEREINILHNISQYSERCAAYSHQP